MFLTILGYGGATDNDSVAQGAQEHPHRKSSLSTCSHLRHRLRSFLRPRWYLENFYPVVHVTWCLDLPNSDRDDSEEGSAGMSSVPCRTLV